MENRENVSRNENIASRYHMNNSLVRSLQHERLQVSIEDCVFDGVEYNLNVVRVDGGREVVVERGLGLATHVGEHVEQEHLHVAQAVRVARELRVEPADVGLLAAHLARQQVRLVQEQDYGDALEVHIVDDRVEDI